MIGLQDFVMICARTNIIEVYEQKCHTLLYANIGIQVVRFEHEPFRIEQLGADHGQDKLFKGHAVILKKAAQGKGKGGQDTHPAHLAAQHWA